MSRVVTHNTLTGSSLLVKGLNISPSISRYRKFHNFFDTSTLGIRDLQTVPFFKAISYCQFSNTTIQRYGFMHLTQLQRRKIAATTIAETPSILEKYAAQGASSDSTFYAVLAPLPPCPNPITTPRKTEVHSMDSFGCLRKMIAAGADPKTTAVLNLASDLAPAGHWVHTLSETQEEALCYSSTLYSTLKDSYYPWDNSAPSGIFSPGVVVYKAPIPSECMLLPESKVVLTSVITVAAPRYPKCTQDGSDFASDEAREAMKEKVRAVFRIAGENKRRNLVLGAMGCGAYGCPKEAVANIMKAVLLEEEFRGWFERVWWAVFDAVHDRNGNIFKEICGGVEIP
jgi:uncharacterized protein (TIGR02452 family)